MEKLNKKNGLPMMEFIYALALTAAIGMNDLGAGMTAFVAFLMYIAFNVCDREYRLFFKKLKISHGINSAKSPDTVSSNRCGFFILISSNHMF